MNLKLIPLSLMWAFLAFTSQVKAQAPQTITFNTISSKKYGDPPFTLTASATSGLPVMFTSSNPSIVTINGNEATILGLGLVTISAIQAGDENFQSEMVQQELTILAGQQEIIFPPIPNKSFGDPSFTINAQATSGLPLIFTSSNTSVAEINGTTLILKGEGTSIITASQAGNSYYEAATPIEQQIQVGPGSYNSTLAKLIKDINKNDEQLTLSRSIEEVNGKIFMALTDGMHGEELWVTDHLEAPPVLFKDFSPGIPSSFPKEFTKVNQHLYFVTFSREINGNLLWITDGTESGTRQIPLPFNNHVIRSLTKLNNGVVFKVDKNNKEFLLYTDGTEEGTIQLKEFVRNTGQFYPETMMEMNGAIYFRGDDGLTGFSVWKTDGTIEGTSRLAGVFAAHLKFTYNNQIYFWGNSESWKSDGTQEGTTKISSFNFFDSGKEFKNAYYFSARDTQGAGLWRIDNNNQVTPIIRGFYEVQVLESLNDKLFLRVRRESGMADELWISNGSSAGTTFFSNLIQNDVLTQSVLRACKLESEVIIFSMWNSMPRIWSTKGIQGDLRLIKKYDNTAFFNLSKVIQNTVVSYIAEYNNSVLHYKIGLIYPEGIEKQMELPRINASSSPQSFVKVGDKVVFSAISQNIDYWITDGNEETTVKVPNTPNLRSYSQAIVGDDLYFNGSTYATGYELWKLNSSGVATMVKDIRPGSAESYPNNLFAFQNKLYFWAYNTSGIASLWRSDGTESGTIQLTETNQWSAQLLCVTENYFYYFIINNLNGKYNLYKSDGNMHEFLREFNQFGVMNEAYSYRYSQVVGNYVLFTVKNNGTGFDLWRMDLTTHQTQLVKQIVGNSPESNLFIYSRVWNGRLYFSLNTSNLGTELWVTDGTPENTILLKDINSGAASANPGDFEIFANRLYFVATDGTHGRELWLTEGTPETTRLVSDLFPGSQDSFPHELTNTNARLLFRVENGEFFEMLSGSVTPHKVNLGVDFDLLISYSSFFENNNLVFFSGYTPEYGSELWALDYRTKSVNTVTFSTENKIFGDPDFTLEATSSTGDPVSFRSLDPSIIEVNGNIAKIKSAGAARLIASSGGDSENQPAVAEATVVVSKMDQTINFPAVTEIEFGPKLIMLTATTTSGLPVYFESTNPSIAVIENNRLKTKGLGQVTILAKQYGSKNYNAATTVEQTVTIVRGRQTIDFGTLPIKKFNDSPFELNAKSSSGLPVSFQISDNSKVQISGSIVTILGAGQVTITASQSGNENYFSANSIVRVLTIEKAMQTISFSAIATKTYGDAPFTIYATSSSGLPVVFNSVNQSKATVNGNLVTLVEAGTVLINATQPGNNNYEAAPAVLQTLVINKANQTIQYSPFPAKTFGDAPFDISAISSSGLPVIFRSLDETKGKINGSTLSILSAGTLIIEASQPGNVNFNPASISQALTIERAAQTIMFGALYPKTMGDPGFNLVATSSAGLPVTFSSSNPNVATINGNVVTLTGTGTTTISASQAGNINFKDAASVSQILEVSKGNQSITFTSIPTLILGQGSYQLNSVSSSGLNIAYDYLTDKIAIVDSRVVPLKPGRASITAKQPGNSSYFPSAEVVQEFCIVYPKPTITISQIEKFAQLLTSSNDMGNQWYLFGEPITNANQKTLKAIANGIYSVKSIVEGCESAVSEPLDLIVTGIDQVSENKISIYPSPAKEVIRIKVETPLTQEVVIQIYNALGQLQSNQDNQTNQLIEIPIEDLNSGYYFFKILLMKEVFSKSFMVER